MTKHVGIIGAGIMGRLIALQLFQKKYKVTIFDKEDKSTSSSCTATAAGMLAPWSEAIDSTELVFQLGIESLSLWPKILQTLNAEKLFLQKGTAHLSLFKEKNKLTHFISRLQSRTKNLEFIEINDINKKNLIGEYSSEYTFGYYLPKEASIDPQEFILKSNIFFKKNKIIFKENSKVISTKNNEIKTENENYYFDVIVDTRGFWAKNTFSQNKEKLRGIRGELILVNAPLVKLNSIVRVTHLRYPIYIVPRENNNYIIGATSIESECKKPITAQSLLELLSVASHFDNSFLEASLLEQRVNIRPTYANNSPSCFFKNGVYYINGLYRNGITIAPAIAKKFCNAIESQKLPFISTDEYNILEEI